MCLCCQSTLDSVSLMHSIMHSKLSCSRFLCGGQFYSRSCSLTVITVTILSALSFPKAECISMICCLYLLFVTFAVGLELSLSVYGCSFLYIAICVSVWFSIWAISLMICSCFFSCSFCLCDSSVVASMPLWVWWGCLSTKPGWVYLFLAWVVTGICRPWSSLSWL